MWGVWCIAQRSYTSGFLLTFAILEGFLYKLSTQLASHEKDEN